MRIEKLDNNGRGITFINNKITFVKNAFETAEKLCRLSEKLDVLGFYKAIARS